jgi:sortase A
MVEEVTTRGDVRRLRRQRRFRSAASVMGEVLLTAGVVVGLFLVWFMGINDVVQGQQQAGSASEVADEWNEPSSAEPEGGSRGVEPPEVLPSLMEPPTIEPGVPGTGFALLYVPRFGENYVRSIGEGVDLPSVLNSPEFGVGRYTESSALGEIGNFALAGHRTTYGASFAKIGELRIGDRLYVEVEQGWYSYVFRNLEYVWPTEVEVLQAFPKAADSEPSVRVLTLTSCHPRFSEAERIIAYAIYEGWFPRSGGPPSDIAHLIEGAT